MKKIIIINLISVLIVMLLGVTTTLAAVGNCQIKSWSADDMEIGDTSGSDGLEFLQPQDADATKVMVTGRGRNNGVGSYSNAIITAGSASMLNKYIPKTRALKFTVEKPCDINIYGYGASSSGTVVMKLSRDGKIVADFKTEHGKLGLYKAFLDSAGTYYIYGVGGSIGVCEIKTGYVEGDQDCDFDVDWNDRRLLRKAVYESYSNDYMNNLKLDINNDDIVTEEDLSDLDKIIDSLSDKERDRAQFVSNVCWKADDMPLGYPETYNGLEFVYKDCDTTNKSIGVISSNKSYYGTKGEVRNYNKCISTDGEMSRANGEYVTTKVVKFNLSTSSTINLYISSGSSQDVQHKARIVDADGNIVKEINIKKEIERYTVELDGNQTYFLGSPTGTLKIYEIEVNEGKISNISSTEKVINVLEGQNYIYNLTVNNATAVDGVIFKFAYNSSDVELVSVGGMKISNLTNNNEIGLFDINVSDGYITFKTDNLTNGESGIVTEVELKANKDCNTKISLQVRGA